MAEAAKSTGDSLAERVVAGDKRALARAISLVENRDPEGDRLVAELFPHTGEARIVGITGPPGVGKSTLIGALTAELREGRSRRGRASIDPSSPFTAGAMLGDRIRLADHFLDPGVFIRSMATRGSLGGLAEAALQAALLMDASGKDDVLLETVGVGQGEIDIVDHADTIVLALMPGSGDSVQALKAGVMEIPDVIVVNKCRPSAGRHDGPRGARRFVARSAGLVEGAGGANRGIQGGGGRRAPRADRRPPPAHRGDRARSPSAGLAIFAPRCWASPRRVCGAGSRIEPTSDPEWQGMLDRVVRRQTDPATAARQADGAGRDRLS